MRVKPQPLAHAAFHPSIFHRPFVSDRLMINKNWHGETMDAQRHWENIYGKKAADAVSWYRPHLETSLELIERAAPEYSASIVDIGGGESTLVDDLLARGYQNISVLDISETAVDANKKRLAPASEQINWLVANITKVTLEPCAYDVTEPRYRWIRSCEDPPKSWRFSQSSAFVSEASSVDEVKSLSPHHRFVIALHSPGGVDETGLPQCPSEKKPRKLAREIQRDIFSGPV
jgi:SAM-dependent methyltransferase